MDVSRFTSTAPCRPTGRRYFTLRQAERALVLVRRIVADIVRDYTRVLELQEMLEAQQARGRVEDLARIKEDMAAVVGRLQRCLEELNDVGVELRDFATGVVDFPAVLDGRPICWCWQFGEGGITSWHEPNDCQAGRRPLEELADLRQPEPIPGVP